MHPWKVEEPRGAYDVSPFTYNKLGVQPVPLYFTLSRMRGFGPLLELGVSTIAAL